MRQICRFLATEPRSGTEYAVSWPKRTITCIESPGRQNQQGKHDAKTCLICARTRFRGQKSAIPPHEASSANEKGMRKRSWMRRKGTPDPCAALFAKRKRPSVPSPAPAHPARSRCPAPSHPRIRGARKRAPCGSRVKRSRRKRKGQRLQPARKAAVAERGRGQTRKGPRTESDGPRARKIQASPRAAPGTQTARSRPGSRKATGAKP